MTTTTYEIETSLTLDYRKMAWGIERIVLDSISNHLPADCHGTKTSVLLKQEGHYVDVREADREKETTEIIFEDNGTGYSAGLLSVLFSPKAEDALSVGQFGEGLKLVAAAALRTGVDMEYYSRNWTAKPFHKPERIDGYDIDRLCFRVTENGLAMNGSRTVFTNPSQALLDEIFQLPQKVLAFTDGYKELHNEKDNVGKIGQPGYGGFYNFSIGRRYNSRIIEMNDGITSLFVKGVRVKRIDAIFSYDLGIDDIHLDRKYADMNVVKFRIESLLKRCTNTDVIELILLEAQSNPEKGYLEFETFQDREDRFWGFLDGVLREEFEPDGFYNPKRARGVMSETGTGDSIKTNKEGHLPENLWVATFKKLFGGNAVIASVDNDANKDAEAMGYLPVKLYPNISNYLISNGIISAHTMLKGLEYHWIERSDLTAEERAMLERVDELNDVILEKRISVDVRVYSGLFTKTGREVESSKGVYVHFKDGTKYIGIKRAELQDFGKFAHTYIHEFGHYVTGVGDYDRRFTEFFVSALARMAQYCLDGKKVYVIK